MRSPKATPEDPAIVAAREREQARAEAARTEETQALTLADTLARIRRFGKLPGKSGGSVPIYAGSTPSASTGGGSASSTAGAQPGGVYSGGGASSGGGFQSGGSLNNTVLY